MKEAGMRCTSCGDDDAPRYVETPEGPVCDACAARYEQSPVGAWVIGGLFLVVGLLLFADDLWSLLGR